MTAFDELNKIDMILITIGEYEYMIPRQLIREEDLSKFKWREFPK